MAMALDRCVFIFAGASCHATAEHDEIECRTIAHCTVTLILFIKSLEPPMVSLYDLQTVETRISIAPRRFFKISSKTLLASAAKNATEKIS